LINFKSPLYLLLLLIIPLAVYFHKRINPQAGLRFSNTALLDGLKRTFRQRLAENLIFLRAFALFFLIMALGRPQTPVLDSIVRSKGVDIILALDISTSMLAEDFVIDDKRYSRVDMVKMVTKKFIKMRKNDRMGLVAFAARTYTVCPLTLDYDWLFKNLERIRVGLVEDGTAIGSAIASSLNRLRNSQAKSKVIILLTDGINNTGRITPVAAAKIARLRKVRVYTIGVGTEGLVPYPGEDILGKKVYYPLQIDLDEEVLKNIASITKARYYRVRNVDALNEVFSEINKLERSPIQETAYREYTELSVYFMGIGIFLLLAEIVLSNTVLRKIP